MSYIYSSLDGQGRTELSEHSHPDAISAQFTTMFAVQAGYAAFHVPTRNHDNTGITHVVFFAQRVTNVSR